MTVPFGTLSGQLLTLGEGAPPDLDTLIRGVTAEPRWRGQTRRPWSLAHHLLLTARLVPPQHRLEALLHDAEEVFLGDWPTPVVQAATIDGLPAEAFRAKVRAWAASPWCQLGAELSGHVKSADRRALIVEATELCHQRMRGWLRPSSVEFGHPTGSESDAFEEVAEYTAREAGLRWGLEVLEAARTVAGP